MIDLDSTHRTLSALYRWSLPCAVVLLGWILGLLIVGGGWLIGLI